MGLSISKLFSGLVWGKKDIRILILGLVRPPALFCPLKLIFATRIMLAKRPFFTAWRYASRRLHNDADVDNPVDRRSCDHNTHNWFQRWVRHCYNSCYSGPNTNEFRSVQYGNLNFDVWDLGGQTSIRPYWRSYYANTAAVIFVIDSTDIERLEIAADELRSMLNEDELKDAALLVFANKQDQVWKTKCLAVLS